jgi:hypothetical protein
VRATRSAGYNFISSALAGHLDLLVPQDIQLRRVTRNLDA